MPNIPGLSAVREGNIVRVRGTKGTSITIRAYLNPDLETYLTVESLFDGYGEITTPKAQDSSSNTNFDLALSVGVTAPPLTVKVVTSDGKGETPPVINSENNPDPVVPIVVDPKSP